METRPAGLAAIVDWLAWPLTIYWICVAWIFFRATDLNHAGVDREEFCPLAERRNSGYRDSDDLDRGPRSGLCTG